MKCFVLKGEQRKSIASLSSNIFRDFDHGVETEFLMIVNKRGS